MVLMDHPNIDRVEQIESITIVEAENSGDKFKRVEILEPQYTSDQQSEPTVYYTEGECKEMRQVGEEQRVLVEDIYKQQEICDTEEIDQLSTALADIGENLK